MCCSVVEEAARSKPPVRKVREAYVALHLLEQRQEEEQGEVQEEEEDEGVGELELERAAKASKLPTSPGFSGGEGRLCESGSQWMSQALGPAWSNLVLTHPPCCCWAARV